MDHIHFRCAFDLRPSFEGTPIFADVVGEVARWIRSKDPTLDLRPSWLLTQGATRRPDGRASVIVDSIQSEQGGVAPSSWALRYEHQDSEFSARRWFIDIGIVVNAGVCRFSIVAGNSLHPSYIGKEPGHLPVTAPRVVRDILTATKWKCVAGTTVLSASSTQVEVGKAHELIRAIEDPGRSCPLVYVSRNRVTNETMLDPSRLAKGIIGAGVVWVAASREIDEEIEFLLVPREFRSPNGTVRVYAPGANFSTLSQAYRHRFFTRAQIEQLSAIEVEGQISRALTRRQGWVSVRPTVSSIDDIALHRRELRRTELQHQTDQASQDELRQMFVEDNARLSQDVLKLRKEKEDSELLVDELEARVDELTDQYRLLEYEAETFRSDAVDAKRRVTALAGAVDAIRQMRILPGSAADVVRVIQRLHGDTFVFTAEALKSAEESDVDPAVTWECLQATAAVLPELVFEKRESALTERFRNLTGFEMTLTEGSQTKKDAKLAKIRRVVVEGKEWDVSAHIKAGKHPGWLRIHFAIDQERKRIIVGHCGDHLETAGTRRRK